MKKAVISLSGGMDSTSLLLKLVAMDYEVFAISFDYGQKNKIELELLQDNLRYLRRSGATITHDLIDISTLGRLFNSALTSDHIDVPEGHFEEEKMKDTVVPNRNAIFSSMLYGYALSLSTEHDEEVKLCLGVHAGDHAVYPDCRPEFYNELIKVFRLGNWNSEKVSLYLPYLDGDKSYILRDAMVSIKFLDLNFDRIFSNSNTCYNPLREGIACGKCGACVERVWGFMMIGMRDPMCYVDGWDDTTKHVNDVLTKGNKDV
jgi:7-cyano-7-deazaguanine synthase